MVEPTQRRVLDLNKQNAVMAAELTDCRKAIDANHRVTKEALGIGGGGTLKEMLQAQINAFIDGQREKMNIFTSNSDANLKTIKAQCDLIDEKMNIWKEYQHHNYNQYQVLTETVNKTKSELHDGFTM